MKKINCIVIDDEPLALGLIVSYVKKTPFLKLVAGFDNPLDAMDNLQKEKVQLIFLDIQMPDLTGVEFARILDKECKVIFTTAHDKYAIEGFQLHALDYLLKPISYEVFLEAAKHAKEYFHLVINSNTTSSSKEEKYLFLKADYQIHRIDHEDILYFEGLKDYVKLYTLSTKEPLIFHSTMKAIEEKLPDSSFMRVHRSFIVALNKIKTIERDRILFDNVRIPISKQYKPVFDEFIKKNFL